MNSYKLVNSKEVQDKAKRLGYIWPEEKKFMENCFLYPTDDGILRTDSSNDYEYYSESDFQEITQADFLALPEPLKVGDWVKTDVNEEPDDGIRIFKVIATMDNKVCWGSHNWVDSDKCTKLTQQQIKILGLE